MPRLSLRAPAALLTLGLATLLTTSASAGECTYNDLLGTFSVTADCEGLKDHSNLGNEQKRMWLSGDWGQVNIIEVPPPYKQDAGQIEFIMSNLGRFYTERRSPGGIQETTIAGQDARVVLEHKMRTSSRSWVFHWQGRNLIMRAVAYGKKKQRMANLDSMSAALTSTFAEAAMVAEPEAPAEKVRDRKSKPVKETATDVASDVKMGSKERADAAKETATETATEGVDAAGDVTMSSKERADAAKETVTETATEGKAETTEAAGDVKAAATETARDAKKGSKERAASTKDKAAGAVEGAVDEAAKDEDAAEKKATDAKDEAEEKARDAVDDAADAAEKAGKGGL